jgi:predicted transcriptional regulator
MAEENSGQKVDPGLVADIVSGYVAKNSVGVDQVAELRLRRCARSAASARTRRHPGGNSDPGGANPAIGAARLRRLP